MRDIPSDDSGFTYMATADPGIRPVIRVGVVVTSSRGTCGKGGLLTREEAMFANKRLNEVPSLPRAAASEMPDVADDAYADGRVTAELERLGMAENTIIVLWGDNGFHLGDLGIWTKHTNYEQATRIPLIIVAPGVAKPGSRTNQPAESVDLFPTLAELAGLPAPGGPQSIDGLSLVPVLKNPEARVRDHAYHAYPKKSLGRAIRTERYRLVEWKQPGKEDASAEFELYDYQVDPLETRNIAAGNPAVLGDMKSILARYPEARRSSD